jgi:hypothetical protein
LKPEELRRSHEELIDAYRLLEAENKRLRAKLEGKPAAAPEVEPENESPRAGQVVGYVDARGLLHTALVLGVVEGDRLKLKVLRHARPDLVLEVDRAKNEEQRNCWKRRTK